MAELEAWEAVVLATGVTPVQLGRLVALRRRIRRGEVHEDTTERRRLAFARRLVYKGILSEEVGDAAADRADGDHAGRAAADADGAP